MRGRGRTLVGLVALLVVALGCESGAQGVRVSPRSGDMPAFAAGTTYWRQDGMTLRDWLAGQALAGGHAPETCYRVADVVLQGR